MWIKDEEMVRNRVSKLSNEELIKMLEEPPANYTPFALEVAQRELDRRGGKSAILEQLRKIEQNNRDEASNKLIFHVKALSNLDAFVLVSINCLSIFGLLKVFLIGGSASIFLGFMPLIGIGLLDALVWLLVCSKVSSVEITSISLTVVYRLGRQVTLLPPIFVKSKYRTISFSGEACGKKVLVKLPRSRVTDYTQRLKALESLK